MEPNTLSRWTAVFGAVLVWLCLNIAAASNSSPDYSEAMDLYKRRMFSEARKGFLEVVAAHSKSASGQAAQFYAIKCLFEARDWSGFNREVESLRSIDPQHPALDDLTFLQAYAFELQGEYNRARRQFTKFIDVYSTSTYASRAREHIAVCESLTEPELVPVNSDVKDLKTAGAAVHSDTTESQEAYRDWLIRLFKARHSDQYLLRSEQFLSRNPSYSRRDEILFYQVKSLRALKRWDEARAKANEIARLLPDSTYGKKMGGAGGRSEDDAAIDFASLVKDYGEHKYSDCKRKIESFLINYPNNWRIPEVCRYKCYALYHSGDPLFMSLSTELLKTKIDSSQTDQIAFLQAAMLVKMGSYEDARELIDQLKETYPESPLGVEFNELKFQSYHREGDFVRLAAEAQKISDNARPPSAEWAKAMFWLGFAHSQLGPSHLDESAKALDALLSASLADSNLTRPNDHLQATAAFWRIWVARRQGDAATAARVVRTVRKEMPDGPSKSVVLERYGNLKEEE